MKLSPGIDWIDASWQAMIQQDTSEIPAGVPDPDDNPTRARRREPDPGRGTTSRVAGLRLVTWPPRFARAAVHTQLDHHYTIDAGHRDQHLDGALPAPWTLAIYHADITCHAGANH